MCIRCEKHGCNPVICLQGDLNTALQRAFEAERNLETAQQRIGEMREALELYRQGYMDSDVAEEALS